MVARSSWVFIVIMVVVAVMAGFGTYFATWAVKVADCRHTPIQGAFLAYCQNIDFGDYEHGAYYLDLQPEAVHDVQQAEVLILGNSTTQFAFSTPATDSFFKSKNLSYYIFGFGYGEYYSFFERLRHRFALNPKLLIINVDEFFSYDRSEPSSAVIKSKSSTLLDYVMKFIFVNVADYTCFWSDCTNNAPIIYRNTKTGEWIWQGLFSPPTEAEPMNDLVPPALTAPDAKVLEDVARHDIDQLHLSHDCIILTGTPSSTWDNRAVVDTLAGALRLPAVYPMITSLKTIDGVHLNAESAERWSSEFMRLFGPALRSCLQGSD